MGLFFVRVVKAKDFRILHRAQKKDPLINLGKTRGEINLGILEIELPKRNPTKIYSHSPNKN